METNIKLLVLDVDGTLTDAGVYILEDGNQFKKFNARDGIGIKEALKAGIEVGIISHSAASKMVETRAKMLGMNFCYVGNDPKLDILNQWKENLELMTDEIAFIGDDINDKDIMQEVGLTACPSDAVDEIKSISDIVLTQKGGDGCVREFIDKYLLNR